MQKLEEPSLSFYPSPVSFPNINTDTNRQHVPFRFWCASLCSTDTNNAVHTCPAGRMLCGKGCVDCVDTNFRSGYSDSFIDLLTGQGKYAGALPGLPVDGSCVNVKEEGLWNDGRDVEVQVDYTFEGNSSHTYILLCVYVHRPLSAHIQTRSAIAMAAAFFGEHVNESVAPASSFYADLR